MKDALRPPPYRGPEISAENEFSRRSGDFSCEEITAEEITAERDFGCGLFQLTGISAAKFALATAPHAALFVLLQYCPDKVYLI